MAELELAGIDLSEISSAKEELLCAHVDRRKTVQFLSVLTIVQAIRDAAGQIVGASVDGNKTKKLLKSLQQLHFPEVTSRDARTADDAKKILQQEHARGPLKIRALGGKQKRKRKKR